MRAHGSALRLSSILCDMWSERAQTADPPGFRRKVYLRSARLSSRQRGHVSVRARAGVIFGRTGVLPVQTGRSSSPGRIDMNILSLTGSTDG